MNGTGARSQRSTTTLEPDLAPLPEFARDTAIPQQSRAPGRGRSLTHGPHVQFAYAAIDAALVYSGGTLIFCLRFAMPNSLAQLRHMFRETTGHTYVGFFLLYAALVVLACAPKALYERLAIEVSSTKS